MDIKRYRTSYFMKRLILSGISVMLLMGMLISCDYEGAEQAAPEEEPVVEAPDDNETAAEEEAPPEEIPPPMSAPPDVSEPEEARRSTSANLVDEIIQSLEQAKIVYNTPETMRLGSTETIELILSPVLTYEELTAELGETGAIDSGEIRVANRMEADLSGQGFAIEALQPDLQAIGSIQATKWRWNVTPNNPGTHSLHLTLSAHIPLEGQDTPYVIRTFDRTIRVEVTISQRITAFIGANWQWLWAAIVVPFAGYLWRRMRKNGKD